MGALEQEQDAFVLMRVIISLVSIRSQEAQKHLMGLVKNHKEPSVRQLAAGALSVLGKKGKSISVLIEALGDRHPMVRIQARMTLESFGRMALQPLTQVLKHQSAEVRTQAKRALEEMERRGFVESFEKIVSSL